MTMAITIPYAWEKLTLEGLSGVLMVVGAPDVGKSTFARYLYRRLCADARVAFLDGDPGQSTLGPPTTLTLAMDEGGKGTFPPTGMRRRWFIGAVSPRGHMLNVLVGAARLTEAARRMGVDAIVYDTCGLVDPARGGSVLKLSKVDLLRPTVVFAIQRGYELESLLVPLRRSRRVRVVDLRPAPNVRRRDVSARRAHRAARFAGYFADARPLAVNWGRLAVFPSPNFVQHRLVSLEDADGFSLGLGVVVESDPRVRQVTLYTPLASPEGVDALRLGDVLVDPNTFDDRRLSLAAGSRHHGQVADSGDRGK